MIEEQLENHLHEGEEEHMHTHVLEDGTTVMHSHGEHGHHHSHAQTKAVLNRLSRAIGHLESIKRMGGRRPGLQRSADPAFRSEICY